MIPVYRSDSYLTVLDTVLDHITVDGDTMLLSFRETLFAEGGGQPPDYGWITACRTRRPVRELLKHKGDVRVRIEPIPGLAKGVPVQCEIDFARRYRIMRLHTAQHALAGALRRLCPSYQTGGMSIDDSALSCEMKFSSNEEISGPEIEYALALIRSAAAEERKVFAENVGSMDEAVERFGALYRPSDPRVVLKGRVRIIVIEDLDANACGGTHVKNLGEIGEIQVQDFQPGRVVFQTRGTVENA